jgi:hypothetical protein
MHIDGMPGADADVEDVEAEEGGAEEEAEAAVSRII